MPERFALIWNNWYGRKQNRILEIGDDSVKRYCGDDLRAEHIYDAIERVAFFPDEQRFELHFSDGRAPEHYQSSLPHTLQAAVRALEKHLK